MGVEEGLTRPGHEGQRPSIHEGLVRPEVKEQAAPVGIAHHHLAPGKMGLSPELGPETYASVADVEALAPTRKLGQGSNPTKADVEIYLELSEAEINAALVNKGYLVPVLKAHSPLAFQFLRRINAQGAVAQLEVSSGNGPNIERTEKVYQASLKLVIEAREIMDAAQDTERDKPRGPGVTTVRPDGENEPFFHRSEAEMQF